MHSHKVGPTTMLSNCCSCFLYLKIAYLVTKFTGQVFPVDFSFLKHGCVEVFESPINLTSVS